MDGDSDEYIPVEATACVRRGVVCDLEESSEELDVASYRRSGGSAVTGGKQCCGFLEILSGIETDAKRLPIEEEITLGRSAKCTLRIRDPFASSRHAKLTPGHSGVILSDLGSRNGTFMGDKRLTKPVLLRDGDVFNIGEAAVRFRLR